ncbi:MAG: UDP-N-acetylmuramate dehydrogenase [Bacteroidetes bacterium]|nr:UDP-N-acetylmuramate dehydrogenase [Bacteroidota bacterium]
MHIEENVSLASLNTFGIEVKAKYFVSIYNESDLLELLKLPLWKSQPVLILGGGSNILFTRDFDGIVVQSCIKGLEIQEENESEVWLRVGAGESWHGLVMHCVDKGWGGIENLSLIPGTAGAAPIQNIGAYGVELKDVLESVDGVHLEQGTHLHLSAEECQFGYRESIFKHQLQKIFFISSITLRLTKRNHILHTEYGAIHDVLERRNIRTPGIRDVSDAVISIRRSKLPDPAELGNAGSFFKNPTVSDVVLERLKRAHPAIPYYPFDNQQFKIAAGWLIEQCGWKGKRIGSVGVHVNQSLVLVNYGRANGKEILQLANSIQRDVEQRFGITLKMEVNIF